ncbi:MAG TPA: c-type cytochrome [Chlorobaculum sp.]|nr:c-type cytochrome [Chlorobaculum sp.]
MDTVAAGKKNKKTGQVVVVDPRGEGLALSCAGCHGTDGKSAGIIPDIYGKSPEYIESALKDFRSGVRTSSVMGRHSKGYSDEEIHLIAQYFGALRKMNK